MRDVGQVAIPMPLRFPETGDSDAVVGQTPWSARAPLDPLFGNEISLIESQRADEGVGCGPGGPPHKLSELSGFGTTKWHWVDNLPHTGLI
jgi:hypothetical protein